MHGITQTEQSSIVQALEDYYQHQYTAEPTNMHIQDDFLQHAKKIHTDRNILDADITKADITQALSTMQKDKTSGLDVLTIEFYQHFFPLLSSLSLPLH